MAVVDSLVPYLLDNVSKLLQEEVELLGGVEGKVEALQKKLKRINGFLRDSDGKRSSHEVKAVLDQIRDDVYDAQDVIDNYLAYKAKQVRRTLLGRAFHAIDYGKILHEVNNKIDNLNTSIDDIYDNKAKYGINEGQPAKVEPKMDATLKSLRENVEEHEVVGFDDHAATVIKLLKEGSSRRQVLSIIGMGGLGKTTLARKVFKENQVQDHFANHCAWAFLSADYKPKDVLLSLLRSLKSVPPEQINYHKAEEEDEEVVGILKLMLRKCLKGTRYLIVMDDVWDIKVWDAIQDAFPDENNGSRILITSREVAIYDIKPFELPRLSDEHSWLLFCKKVFKAEDIPKEADEVREPAREMVEKCKGLPLSIIILAGLLRQKERTEKEWNDVNRDVLSRIAEDDVGRVKDILKLSYNNLPPRLKPCFLYLAIFPEDFEIPVRQLIRLWVAEGLVGTKMNLSVEEVAENDYLKQLIQRNLLEVVTKRTDGGPKTCRIHDHLRQLCIDESREDKFFEIRTVNNIREPCRPRKLSVHCSIPFFLSAASYDPSSTRSLLFFGQEKYKCYGESWLRKRFKLLRVLDFGAVSGFNFPKKIEKLIHLRYLRAYMSSFYSIDMNLICELENLETLDLRSNTSSTDSLPADMWKLKQLRHFYISSSWPRTLPKSLETQIMWNLQTLCFIALNRENLKLLEKGRLPNLRKLGLAQSDSGDGDKRVRSLFKSLECLTHLNTLKITKPPLFEKSKHFPPNLTKITLVKVFTLKEENLNALGDLPSLQYLKVRGYENPYEYKCLRVPAGFNQLKVFELTSLGFEKLEMKHGAMLKLRRLVVKKCENLTRLPDELCSSTSLREVEVCQETEQNLENLETLKKDGKLIVKD